MSYLLKLTVKKTPMLVSTTINHYRKGPPQPSWDLKFHLAFALIKSFIGDLIDHTIEQAQQSSKHPVPLLPDIIANESK
ncbi:16687_t:CDS:1, partial [Funneliformis caledonium]